MSSSHEDDELLQILLINLRNASKTFGEESPRYREILSVLEDHLQSMRAKGRKTNVSGFAASSSTTTTSTSSSNAPLDSISRFGKLAIRPKPGTG